MSVYMGVWVPGEGLVGGWASEWDLGPEPGSSQPAVSLLSVGTWGTLVPLFLALLTVSGTEGLSQCWVWAVGCSGISWVFIDC